MQAAPSQGRDIAAARRARKARARRARKVKKQATNALEAIQDGQVVNKFTHFTNCKRARRWLQAQWQRPDRGGIDNETRKQLIAFWTRREHTDQMTTTVNETGGLESVPALSEDAIAVWRRFEGGEGVEEEGSKADEQGEEDGEEGGEKLDDGGGVVGNWDDEIMHGFCGQPEPVPADEYQSRV